MSKNNRRHLRQHHDGVLPGVCGGSPRPGADDGQDGGGGPVGPGLPGVRAEHDRRERHRGHPHLQEEGGREQGHALTWRGSLDN